MSRLRVIGLLSLSLCLVAAASHSSEPPPVFLDEWGQSGTGGGDFNKPHGVAVDASGNVYVTDGFHDRIQKFDSNGTFLRMWGWGVQDGSSAFQVCTSGCQEGTPGAGDGQVDNPWGVAVDSVANVYVADFFNHRVQKFDSSGTFLEMWGWGVQDGSSALQVCTSGCQKGLNGAGDGQLSSPTGIAVDSSGNVYTCQYGSAFVQVFNGAGTFLSKWGGYGTGDGELDGPQGLTVDSFGNVYVADTFNNRIQKLDSSGNFVTKWGTYGTGATEFDSPQDVAVDSRQDVYVADFFNHRVQKFDSNGAFLLEWGTQGSGDGEFMYPLGVAVPRSGRIYVADTHNERVQVFGGPWLDVFVGEPELLGDR
jgi:sugar lactone lactonase YvrE